MKTKNKKELSRNKRHKRIRMRVHGSLEKPRLVVRRSLKNIAAQIVDDSQKKVLFGLSSLDKEIRKHFPNAGNVKSAVFFGEYFAKKAKEKGFSKVIYDRAGYLYHGRIKAFAEALRKGGLEF